ncbi:hypothetical protein [Pseudomonas cichorii]|uniref:hypothetical protein n=1 Tax=Pseudomonas cichorii TaxID=36746 RepID=UPI0019102CAB|nr:hypothetical protein [Pseudomonas cichorii]
MHCNGLNDFEEVGFHISCTLNVAIVGAGLQLSRLVKGIQEAPQTQSRCLSQDSQKDVSDGVKRPLHFSRKVRYAKARNEISDIPCAAQRL